MPHFIFTFKTWGYSRMVLKFCRINPDVAISDTKFGVTRNPSGECHMHLYVIFLTRDLGLV
jgi:hypothetical protein